MSEERKIQVQILRYDPAGDREPRYQTYQVPWTQGLSVSNVLQHIWEKIDPSLAFYLSCRTGKCRGCFLEVNGEVRLACTTLVEGDLILQPWSQYQVIKDLVVDMASPKDLR